ncbi:unnamed protein product [Malus baccata var. baccata]
METTKSEEIRQKIKKVWISENKFPDDIKKEIENSIGQAWEKDKYVDVDNPFLILPRQTKESVKYHLFMGTLKTVKKLEDMNAKVLKMMCDYLKPVTYSENSFIFRTGGPLDCMLFILKGTMWTFASSDSQAGNGIASMATKPLGKCDFYGEELLDWASNCFTKVPVSNKNVKSQTRQSIGDDGESMHLQQVISIFRNVKVEALNLWPGVPYTTLAEYNLFKLWPQNNNIIG